MGEGGRGLRRVLRARGGLKAGGRETGEVSGLIDIPLISEKRRACTLVDISSES